MIEQEKRGYWLDGRAVKMTPGEAGKLVKEGHRVSMVTQFSLGIENLLREKYPTAVVVERMERGD